MKNCCGPFKRGKPAKAKNPSLQCFVDCCGNLCPPDNCCDSVKLYYECGCGCDCVFNGYNFTGLVFKRKKKRKKRHGLPDIPTFSKSVLEANGFTFAAATVPTPPSSSSSSSSDCCDWDGNTYIEFPPECGGLTEDVHLDKVGPNEWYGSGKLSCGDTYHATITCDPDVPYEGPASCLLKWSLDLTIDCASGLQLKGMKKVCTCNAPPVWSWTADLSNCGCCVPPSSSSSSSSCVCRPIEINITTDGCCLYMLPEGIEAVGSGTVVATHESLNLPNCDIAVLLNGELDSTTVSDGDQIQIEIQVIGDCECCETQRDCVAPAETLWVQKSNKNKKTIVLDKVALMKKVKFAAERVRGKKKT